MRLFVAIELPSEVRARVEEIQSQLRRSASELSWVAAQNFHLTLKFLGETPRERLDAIAAVLEKAASRHDSFQLELGGVGAFPSLRQARVVWLGVEGEVAKLARLAEELDRDLGPLGSGQGFLPEKRSYSAHLTLGRRRQPRRDPELARVLEQESSRRAGSFRVAQLALMQSELRRSGAIYTRVRGFDLNARGPRRSGEEHEVET